MRLTPLALLTLLGVGVSASAQAQQLTAPNIVPQRSAVFGVDLLVKHDSNITGTSGDAANLRGLARSDWTYEPALNVAVVQPFGRQAAFLNGYVGYDLHDRNERLNRARANLMGGVTGSVGPCHATVFGNYIVAQTELSEAALTVVSNLATTTAEAVSVTCGRNVGFYTQGLVQHQDVSNSAEIQKLADHTIDAASLVLGYRNPSLGNLSLVSSYSRQDFPNRRTLAGVGDGYDSITVGLSYERKLGSRADVVLTAGDTILKRDTAPVGVSKDFNSFTYSGDLTYRLGSRIVLTGHASHAITPSNRPGKLYDVVTDFEGDASYRFGSRFTATVGAIETRTRSNTDTTLPVLVVTNSTLKAVYGTLSYRQSAKTSIDVGLRHVDRTANIAAFGYKNTEISTTLHQTF